jgi:hypothetical protein
LLFSHDLTRCPVSAADSIVDLNTPVDSSSTDLNALLNITGDKKTNKTDVDSNEIQPCEDYGDGQPANKSDKSLESSGLPSVTTTVDDETKSTERPPVPPPIATFEEWTKEKLKRPVEQQQNGVSLDQKIVSPTGTQANSMPAENGGMFMNC